MDVDERHSTQANGDEGETGIAPPLQDTSGRDSIPEDAQRAHDTVALVDDEAIALKTPFEAEEEDAPFVDTTSVPLQPESPRVVDERQCRICLGGIDDVDELGPLIRPCKCKGSISFVHVKCLNTWRTQSASAFWQCPQCHFRYAFARTRALGLATSKVAIGTTTILLFTFLVFLTSAIVSAFFPNLAIPSKANNGDDSDTLRDFYLFDFSYSAIPNALSDLVRLAVATFTDIDISELFGVFNNNARSYTTKKAAGRFKKTVKRKRRDPNAPPSFISRAINKFIIGVSTLGMVSFLQLSLSMSLFAPLQMARSTWIRRRRGERAADGFGTILIVLFVAIGIARALVQVYRVTNYLARVFLRRAEMAILDVDGIAHFAPNEDDGLTLRERVWRGITQYVAETAVAWDPRRWREWEWGFRGQGFQIHIG